MVDKNHYLIALSETLCPLVWEEPLTDLSIEEQVFVCVFEVEREVNNGGFDQFFRNSFGRYGRESVNALETIGAPKMAKLARKALAAAFPSGEVPWDRERREDALERAGEALDATLNELDAEFYKYPEDLTELLFDYVQSNLPTIRGAVPA